MATYTIELGKLLSLEGFDIGMKDYPVPSFLTDIGDMEQWREALNQKIINHYYFNEICCLPPDRFKFFLNNTLNEQMPYFNMLYNALNEKWQFYTGGTLTEIIKDDGTSATTDTKTGSDTSKMTGTDELARSGIDTTSNITTQGQNSNSYNLTVSSDTPGQMLNIETDIANNSYANNAVKQKNNGSSNGNSNSTDTTTYNSKETTTHNTTNTTSHDTKTQNDRKHNDNRNRTVSGLNNKSYAELFKEYSESIRNLDLEVIDSVKDCFMGIL